MQQVIHQTKKYTKEKNLHALYPTVILQEQTRSSIYFLRHDVILSLTSMWKHFESKPHISDTGINALFTNS